MKKLIFTILSLIIFSSESYASHYQGADISYRHLKNQAYEVNLVFYRKCYSQPFPTPDIAIINDSFRLYSKMTRVKIEDLMVNCSTKICNPANSLVTNSYGIEVHYYKDTIDFNVGNFKLFNTGKHCKAYFAFETCCRPSIQQSVNIHVEAMLDLCYAQNNSVSTSAFYNHVKTYTALNQPLYYSFRTMDYFVGDSISYELVKGKDAYNYESNFYGGKMPIRPFCLPPGSYNCTPQPSILPPKGFYFNEKNGNMILTFTGENAVVCIIKTFRVDSGKQKLVGYSKRDMQVESIQTNNILPYFKNYQETFTIKAREKFCTDIVVKDDSSFNQAKDNITLKTIAQPKYGQLSLLDSSAKEKTLHYCWNPSDSDYLKKRIDDIFLYAYDQACVHSSDLSSSIYFKVIAPDSFTYIHVKTFYDINKNGKRETGEPYRSMPLMIERNGTVLTLKTDSVGHLNYQPFQGQFRMNILRNQFTYATHSDFIFKAEFDSSYSVELGFNYEQGIRGKVFEDVNANCTFDVGIDKPLKFVKVLAQNSDATAITDENGDYLFNQKSGSYTLYVDKKIGLTSICVINQNVIVQTDSQFINYNFPLKAITNFKDIGIRLNPVWHDRNNAQVTQQIVLQNYSPVKITNFYIKLISSRKLYGFSSPSSYVKSLDTTMWQIDSVSANGKKTISINHDIMKDSFDHGSQITYQLWAVLKDSNASNNYFELTETVTDSVCCKNALKSVYTPKRYFPLSSTITYQLNYTPLVKGKRTMWLTDTLDDTRLNLQTLQLWSGPENYNAYLKSNVLFVDVSNSTNLTTVPVIYSVDLKQTISDSFLLINKASAKFDFGTENSTNTVVSNIVSPINYQSVQPTSVCEFNNFNLNFTTNYKPKNNNHFKVYLSDSDGNFTQSNLLLDTLSYGTKNNLKLRAPKIYKTGNYKLKVIGTSPALEAFSTIDLPRVYMNQLPSINYTTNLKNGKICYGDTLRLNAFGADEYKFTNISKPSSIFTKSDQFKESLSSNAYYTISFKSAAGCINTSPIINVAINQLPNVKLLASDTVVCDGNPINFNYQGAKKYILYKDNVMIDSTSVKSNFIITPPFSSGVFQLYGTDLNACQYNSPKKIIVVLPQPAVPTITRVNRALKSSANSDNQWYLNNIKIDSAINQFFYPPFNGMYSVRVNEKDKCNAKSVPYNVTFTGLKPIEYQPTFNLYPNPSNDLLSIENLGEVNYTCEIYDAYGRLILSKTSKDLILELSTTTLVSGNYSVQIRTEMGIQFFKIGILH